MKYIFAVTAALTATSATADTLWPYTDLLVFGDSLSDPGNINYVTGGTVPPKSIEVGDYVFPLYAEGQFTNGDTWATELGADFESGTNFAFGGAEALDPLDEDGDPDTDDLAPDFADQRALFDAAYSNVDYQASLGDNPLTAIWFGGNDLRVLLDPEAPPIDPLALIDSVTTEIVTGIFELANTQLNDFLVFGLPDLGLIPAVVGDPVASAGGTFLSDSFNAMLAGKLDYFFTDNPLINVSYFDTKSFFAEVLEDAEELGVTNLTDACLVEDDPETEDVNEFFFCGFEEDPNTYAFFDGLHPTQPIHSALAAGVREFITPVPLPNGMSLALGGIALLGFAARRRKVA